MNHMLLGCSIPLLVWTAVYAARRFRASPAMLVCAPVSLVVFALWAVAPDIPRLLGLNRLYLRLSLNPRCDMFFWHYSIDKIETESVWYIVGLVSVMAALLFAAWRELALAENPKPET